jgi:hypothetical protein
LAATGVAAGLGEATARVEARRAARVQNFKGPIFILQKVDSRGKLGPETRVGTAATRSGRSSRGFTVIFPHRPVLFRDYI